MGRTYRRRPEVGPLKIRYTSWLTRKKKTKKKQTDKENTQNDKPEGERPNRSLINLPSEIISSVMDLLDWPDILRFSGLSKQLLPFKYLSNPCTRTLIVPRIHHQNSLQPNDSHEADEISGLAKVAHREASRILEMDPLVLREIHLIPMPLANHQVTPLLDINKDMESLCPESYTHTIKGIIKARNLRSLRIDMEPPGPDRWFPSDLAHLEELQVPSVFIADLAGLPLQKLTVVYRPYRTSQVHHLTIRDLPKLTHLNLVAEHTFNTSKPLLDFRSLPKLRYLAISQRRRFKHKELTIDGTPEISTAAKRTTGPTFTYLGSPEGLHVLSLVWTSLPTTFQRACQKLRHLHLVDIATSEPFIFPKLEVLELVDCVLPVSLWDKCHLPALRHILDITDTRFLFSRASNPLACLGKLLQNLETIIAVYPEGTLSPRGPWNAMFGTLETLKKTGKLKRAMTLSNHMDTDYNESWGYRRASRGKFSLNWSRIQDFQRCDDDQSFIQTRMAHLIFGLQSSDPSQSHVPLESQYYNSYFGCAWRWRRNVLASPRISFMDDIRLLNGKVVYRKLGNSERRIYPVVQEVGQRR